MRIKVITSILITFLLLLLSYYPIMYVNTNSIVNYAENVFKGKVDYSEIKNTPIEIYYPDEINFKKVGVNIKRLIVIIIIILLSLFVFLFPFSTGLQIYIMVNDQMIIQILNGYQRLRICILTL